VVIDGITLHNSTSWEIVPTHCNRFNINNIKIVSDQPSDDGIDILHSKNVTIENSFIRTRDDCISIKSYIDYTKNDGVDSVLVQNCVFWNGEWGNCLEIGYELFSGETKNIIFRNCDIIHVEDGAAISIHNAGSSNVKNILYENIRIEDSSQKLFDFAIFKSRYRSAEKYMYRPENLQYLNGAWDGVLSIPADKKDFYAQFRGTISNVTLRNIQVNGRFPFSIFYGFDNAHKVSNVVTENLTINGKKIINLADAKFYIEKADNIIIK
jgi:polygalacturonase